MARKMSFWDLVHDGAIAWGKTTFVFVPFAQDAIDLIDRVTSENVISRDPNEKVGPAGIGEQRYVPVSEALPYEIYFENVATAAAPAQEVVVTDTLDPDLDWTTFRLTEIAWGDQIIALPQDAAEYSTRVTVEDYRPGVKKSWWVDISVEVDAVSGRVRWTFRIRDPETGELPVDPLAGFLPPDDETGRGEGHIGFTILPRASDPIGTILTNQASIVFDVNQPIVTNEVKNIVGISYQIYLPLLAK